MLTGPGTLGLTGLVFACLGVVFAISGWSLALLLKVPGRGGFELRKNDFSVRIAYTCIVGGGLALGVAVVALLVAGLWWGVVTLFADATPGKLALFSIIIGTAPLLITAFASAIAAVLGGSVDANGTRNCIVLGMDIGPVLHSMFMAYWLVFVTGGLAIFGLMGSGIWALIRLF